jgi:hypothetical protein
MGTATALITGASSGLGTEFARQLAAKGMDLILVARRKDRLEALRGEIEKSRKVQCHVLARDLSLPEASEELFQETNRQGWNIDWLVNNAGFGTHGSFVELPLDRELEELRLNICTLVALARLYLPGMVSRKRGQIVNLGSIGSFVPTPYMATYSATKAFVLSFSEALASELSGSGVHVLVVCPGATKTEFQQVAGVSDSLPEFTYMSAEAVVRQSIAAAKSGKRSIVTGWMNKVTAVSTRLTPRAVLARVAGSMFEPKTPSST